MSVIRRTNGRSLVTLKKSKDLPENGEHKTDKRFDSVKTSELKGLTRCIVNQVSRFWCVTDVGGIFDVSESSAPPPSKGTAQCALPVRINN